MGRLLATPRSSNPNQARTKAGELVGRMFYGIVRMPDVLWNNPYLIGARVQPSDHRHTVSRSSPEQRDERAAAHSITSSARASSVGGTSRPGAVAVLRLMTS